ncbi:MAG: tetratricopeptide repeat protein, partial [Acidobacteriales bacterium]|nr:tetratricopeptide repeat protein [Terriglobales bacterium]
LGDPCSGGEARLAQISKQLTVNSLAGVKAGLDSLSLSYPDCPQIVLQRARLAEAEGNPTAAADLYYRYTDADPDDSTGLAYFGRFFLAQRDYMRADALSSAAVARNANDPAALSLRGQILIMHGAAREGQALLERSIQLDPDNPEAQFQLGAIYDKAKSAAKAAERFRAVVALNSRDARAWDYLALNLEPLGDLEGAEQAYRNGLQANQPGSFHDAFLDYNYGRFLAKRNDLRNSKEHLDRAVELTPQVRAVWYERAKLDMRLQNYQQARADGEKAATCIENGGIIDLQVYSLLSQVYTRLGEPALAKKYTDLTRATLPPVRGESR